MSCDGFVLVALPIFNKEGLIRDIAHICLDEMTEESEKHARKILEYLVDEKGLMTGSKGDGLSCCFVGNYVNDKKLCEDLLPFFKRLWPQMATHQIVRMSWAATAAYLIVLIVRS